MKITKIETIRFEPTPDSQWKSEYSPAGRQALPNNLWVKIHTDEGLVGLGETYYSPRAVSAIIHDLFAPLLIGREAANIENHWNNLFSIVNFCGHAGAEMRGISAIDIALWDLFGQATNRPIYELLGGQSRNKIAIYNTCVGSNPYDDDLLLWSNGKAGELAASLLEQGITAMKFWPFDQFGPTLGGPNSIHAPVTLWGGETAAGVLGHSISNDQLTSGLQIVEQVRNAVGNRMQIAIEGHARWDLPSAIRIAKALEPLDIMWLEEIMPPDNVEAYVRLKSQTAIPICQSERLLSRYAFRPFIEQHACDIVMPDASWCGGITEARKIATMADTYYLPVTLHDTIGPVALIAAAHLMLHLPNALIMETVRGYLAGWYREVVTDPIAVRDGALTLENRPGLGTRFNEELKQLPNCRVETTDEGSLTIW